MWTEIQIGFQSFISLYCLIVQAKISVQYGIEVARMNILVLLVFCQTMDWNIVPHQKPMFLSYQKDIDVWPEYTRYTLFGL